MKGPVFLECPRCLRDQQLLTRPSDPTILGEPLGEPFFWELWINWSPERIFSVHVRIAERRDG